MWRKEERREAPFSFASFRPSSLEEGDDRAGVEAAAAAAAEGGDSSDRRRRQRRRRLCRSQLESRESDD